MLLNVVKAITENSAASLVFFFYEDQVIRICRQRRLYQGEFRAKYWINLPKLLIDGKIAPVPMN